MLKKINSYIQVSTMNEHFKVRIFELNHGLREYDEVKLVRITSQDYNLLIMVDYLPLLGEFDGNIDIKGNNVELSYKNIKGFYMNSNNVFNLMINEGYDEQIP